MSAAGDRLARKTLALLTRFGKEATLTRRSAGLYDPATGAAPAGVTTHPVRVLVQSDRGQEQEGDEAGRETAVVASRRKVLVAASGLAVAPAPGDEVGPLEGRTWRVVRLDPPVELQGTPLLYVLGVAS